MKNIRFFISNFPKLLTFIQLTVDVCVSFTAYAITDIVFQRYDIYFTAVENFGYLYFPVITILTILFCKLNSVYDHLNRRLDETISRTLAALIKSFTLILLSIYFLQLASSRKMILMYGILLVVFLLSLNIARWYLYRALRVRRATLLIAGGTEAEWLFARITSNNSSPYHIVKWTDSLETALKLNLGNIETVILGTGFGGSGVSLIADKCMKKNIQLIFIPVAFSIISNGASMSTIDDIMVFSAAKYHLDAEELFVKRILDITISILALVLFSPLMLIVAIGIKISSPGPVLYTQLRVGRNNKEFTVYKFRSMCDNAENSTGIIKSTANDTRLTKFGNFIRKTRLDELPQFINTLIGNMSVVGPRPERKFFTDVYEQEIPFYSFRHNVNPGITGMAQIYGKYNTAPEFKTLYDLYYINKCKKWGILLADISIMLQTINVFFSRSKAEGTFDLKSVKTMLHKSENDN